MIGKAADESRQWQTLTADILVRAFGDDSEAVRRFKGVSDYDFISGDWSEEKAEAAQKRARQKRLLILDGLIAVLAVDAGNQSDTPNGSVALTTKGNKFHAGTWPADPRLHPSP